MIVWLASYPKSGNTWVRVFLANWLADKPVGINDIWKYELSYSDSDLRLQKYVGGADGWDKRHEVQKLIADPLTRPRDREYPFPPQTDIFVKTHVAVTKVGEVKTINADVTNGAVYIVRDPRDVALSLARYLACSVDEAIEHMGDDNKTLSQEGSVFDPVSSWSRHVTSWLNSGVVTSVLKYEDLCAKPVHEFRRMLKSLGLPVANTDRIRRAAQRSSLAQLTRQERREGFREANKTAFFGEGGSRWREHLTQQQAASIAARHGEVMARFGYLPNMTNVVWLGATRAA